MALTQKEIQALQRHGMDKLYTKYADSWNAQAKQAYDYTRQNFPDGAKPRIDDVAGVFEPILEIDKKLVDFLQEKKLSQRYWLRYFCDYILDQVWAKLNA